MMCTVERIQENNLCIGCGSCEVVCPVNAIGKILKDGLYVPRVNIDKCVNCGLCYNLCPGRGFDYKGYYQQQNKSEPDDLYIGVAHEVVNLKTKNTEILQQSVSGGFVTTAVKALLELQEYDSAFLVDTYRYDNEVVTNRYVAGDALDNTTKSRYVTISHANTMRYMLANRDEKIIIVATSCGVHALLNVIAKYKLKRENYLLIGLFCDKTMTHNVYQHFREHPSCTGELENLFFRTKEASGWPGNVRLQYKNGTHIDLDKTERMKVKEYYMPEKCLYCLDKLNQFADISVGDNYTKDTTDTAGSSSALIRTEQGQRAFSVLREFFDYHESTLAQIAISQHITVRQMNSSFLALKNSELLIPSFEKMQQTKGDMQQYKDYLKKISIGKQGSYQKVVADINQRNNFRNKVKRKLTCFVKKTFYS